jgi:A/G-specific adenine glycosylase
VAGDFSSRLVSWQRQHGRRDLPWQGTRDAYRIWVSEIMLQQTQVATVIPYYARFMAAFPDVAALAAANIESVLRAWSGLGYYRRAHLMHRAAQQVVDEHDGAFPRDAATLATLPGIGRSTAAAIAAFASGERGAILDGNVKRVLARHAGIDGYPGDAAVTGALWREAEARLPAGDGDIGIYTQAMMDLGATVCVRREPRCEACPVAADCVARRDGRTASLPSPRPKRALPRRRAEVALILDRDAVLLERRPPSGIWAGLWSLPEIADRADAMEVCRARFGVDVEHGPALPEIEHAFTHFTLTIAARIYRARVVSGRNAQAAEPGSVWLPLADVAGAALPAPVKRLLVARAWEVAPDLLTAATA